MENGNASVGSSPEAAATAPGGSKHTKANLDVSHSDPLHVFKSLDKASTAAKRQMAVEDIYQRKTQLEHILLRPDTYIGSVEPHTDNMWVYDESNDTMVQRNVSYVPGLYKIFDEIMVNAADNKQRDPRMTCIKVTINRQKNEISIWNNGKGIPVVEHKVEKMYVPELIFGTLLTSSNYDDSERKVTGGRNGYGAKLCNIFSKKFTVTTSSRDYKKKFKQVWQDNMTKTDKPVVVESDEDDYTCVSFVPDLNKFGMTTLDDDIVALMSRRAYDVAGTCPGVRVFLNNKRLTVNNFKEYVALYTKSRGAAEETPLNVVYERPHVRWEVMMTVSDKGFQQVSFVNSIATMKGGRHVDYVTDMIVERVIETVKKQTKKTGMSIRPFQVKNHLWVFINCLIENPTFDSQTKENMTLNLKSFGSKCNLSDAFYKNVMKSGILESVMEWMKYKAQVQLNKQCHSTKHSKLKGVPKLEDANEAGTKNSQLCTLILTEGDSAKTLAVAGFSVVGRDLYGVFPLRGKLLNVREASHKQIMANPEINNLVKILGLQYRHKYDSMNDLKTLRYGKVMIMADQDQDGSHIKGLVINFIHHNWPSLIRHNFVEEFITPIVKAFKGSNVLSFFSVPEYEEWKAQTPNWATWRIKYYKGLGTSSAKEAKEYFGDMGRHRIRFKYDGNDDDKALELAFSKKKVDDRKEWLTKWMDERKRQRIESLPETYLYESNTHAVTYRDFVDKELVLFSNMDNERSIPSLVDGLKPGQRKVLFTCFKRNDKREVKVAQLSGSVAEMSAYHHGETSLMGTIVNLAHNFVGSNNVNLLLPIGQFGTRLQGGKDAASARYIFTKLNPVARALFNVHDEPCLRFLFDDNQRIEPEWYCPVVPTVLINGAEGIGTAWATKVPNYNPRDLVANIRRMIRDEQPTPMKPWYRNFQGTIEDIGSQRYACFGRAALLDDTHLEITELPISVWTQNYKESVLEPMLQGSDSKAPLIQDYKEYHTDVTVRFVIQMAADKLAAAEREGIFKVFKLQNFVLTTQMVLFDADGCLRKFASADEVLRCFYDVRLVMYEKRKAYMQGMLQAQANRLSNQARFIVEKIDGILKIENVKKKDIVKQLVERNYDPDPVAAWKQSQSKQQDDEEATVEDNDDEAPAAASGGDDIGATKMRQYDYLLSMTIVRLSKEEKERLLKERDDKCQELEDLKKKTPKDIWLEDLDKFLEELAKWEKQEKEDEEVIIRTGGTTSTSGKPGRKGGATTKRQGKLHSQVFPSSSGIPVMPTVSEEIRQKVEKVEQAKQRQILRKEAAERGDTEAIERLKPKGRVKKENAEKVVKATENLDENNAEVDQAEMPKRPRQKKINEYVKVESSMEDDEDVQVLDVSDSEEQKQPPATSTAKRAVARRPVLDDDSDDFVVSDDDEEEEDEEEEVYDDDDDFLVSSRKRKKGATPVKKTAGKSAKNVVKKGVKKVPATTKPTKRVIKSDSDIETISDDGGSIEVKPKQKPSPKKRPAKMAVAGSEKPVEKPKPTRVPKKKADTAGPSAAAKKSKVSVKPAPAKARAKEVEAASDSTEDDDLASNTPPKRNMMVASDSDDTF